MMLQKKPKCGKQSIDWIRAHLFVERIHVTDSNQSLGVTFLYFFFFSRAILAVLFHHIARSPEGEVNVVIILCPVGPWNLVFCQMKRINSIKLFNGLHATFQFL